MPYNPYKSYRRLVNTVNPNPLERLEIMAEFIYQMYQARKAVGDKVILDDVTLSFYPGAKIGVVGPNGMGKSTLLKVMAGFPQVMHV